jgi:hypothetical protein
MATFHGFSSALWRGYRGIWAVRGGKLWLVDLQATTKHVREDGEDRDLAWLFPDAAGPVPADWFSGELLTGCGQAVRGVPYTFEFPRHRVFHVERGHVVRIEVRDNRDGVRRMHERYAAWRAVLGEI